MVKVRFERSVLCSANVSEAGGLAIGLAKSGSGSNLHWGIMLTLSVQLLALALAVGSSEGAATMGCQEVRYSYSAKGFNVYDIPLVPQSGKSRRPFLSTQVDTL